MPPVSISKSVDDLSPQYDKATPRVGVADENAASVNNGLAPEDPEDLATPASAV